MLAKTEVALRTCMGRAPRDADGARDAVSEIISSVISHADGPILGACERAEAFLARWQDDLPFGRPMAA